jgi:hypothetical protein
VLAVARVRTRSWLCVCARHCGAGVCAALLDGVMLTSLNINVRREMASTILDLLSSDGGRAVLPQLVGSCGLSFQALAAGLHTIPGKDMAHAAGIDVAYAASGSPLDALCWCGVACKNLEQTFQRNSLCWKSHCDCWRCPINAKATRLSPALLAPSSRALRCCAKRHVCSRRAVVPHD